MIVTFQPLNKTVELTAACSLLEAADQAGILINGTCAGRGTCGRCKVKVDAPNQPLSSEESGLLTAEEISQGYRLACKVLAEEGLVVEVPDHHQGSDRKKALSRLPDWFKPDIAIKKVAVQVEKASLENQKSDADRVLAACGLPGAVISTKLLAGLHDLLEDADGCLTVTINGNEVIDLEKGNRENDCYGVAFDIGTTTVVAMLWDLKTQELIEVGARTNPQSVFGADVISRIQYSVKSAENLAVMRQKIIDCFNDLIEDFCVNHQLAKRHLYSAAVVGNTTMSHLFLGINPGQMARTPFTPVFCGAVQERAFDLRLAMHPAAEVCLLPNIAGHVGSDLTAALVSCRLKELPGANLVIDIGTNGEILLALDGRIMACSTAAGPAFEGAAIYQGMRATTGAIEGVYIEADGEVLLEVIDDDEPVGLCGSGLIDAVAELLDKKLLGSTGRLLTREKALQMGIDERLAARLYEGEQGGGFILYEGPGGGNVVLTQKDVREVQLAKGAIAAGIKLMMDAFSLPPTQLDRVMIAGAFGNYVKKSSALRIGLLPQIAEEKVKAVGNAAGTGASMALLSQQIRAQATAEAAQVLHLELATHPQFQDEYLSAMYFPK